MISVSGLPSYTSICLKMVPLLWQGSICSIQSKVAMKLRMLICHFRADIVVSPWSSNVRKEATSIASITDSFANGSQGDVPALVRLLDLYLLLRHLYHTSMAKTTFWRLISREGMPGLLYYHKYGPDAGAHALLGPMWSVCQFVTLHLGSKIISLQYVDYTWT